MYHVRLLSRYLPVLVNQSLVASDVAQKTVLRDVEGHRRAGGIVFPHGLGELPDIPDLYTVVGTASGHVRPTYVHGHTSCWAVVANQSYQRFAHIWSPHTDDALGVGYADDRVPRVLAHVADMLEAPAVLDYLLASGDVEVLEEPEVVG